MESGRTGLLPSPAGPSIRPTAMLPTPRPSLLPNPHNIPLLATSNVMALLATPQGRIATVPVLRHPIPRINAAPRPVNPPTLRSANRQTQRPTHPQTLQNTNPPAQRPSVPAAQQAVNNNRGGKEKEDEHTNKVHVSGFPPYTQASDLLRVFARFGNVRVEKLVSRMSFAYLAFNTADEARQALQANKKLNIYGDFLHVRPYGRCYEKQQQIQQQQQQQAKREFVRTKQKSNIIAEPQKLDLSGDFEKQLKSILTAVQLTDKETTAVHALYNDLNRVLQAQWPGCYTIPFGSITTGLGIKTSDADCFIQMPPQHQNPNTNFIVKAKRILQAYPHLFAEILSIPRANTPIIKFFHVPTETNCDLSFKTPLGAQNSKLIAFLLNVDERLIPMAVLIKYWAKIHNLSGTGKLTNYALTMMIIFYLQQPPISILPSVEWLQRDRRNDVIVDFWNTGIINNKDLLPKYSNRSSISELIGKFFEYYALFNFDDMVVCPYLGYPIKKELFRDLRNLPPQFERYKSNVFNHLAAPLRFMTAMCVQDPFEQSHNVASAISPKFAEEIKAYFQFAATMYESDKPYNCKEFLKMILCQKPKIVRVKNHPEYRINLFPRIIVNIIDPEWKSIVKDIVFTIFEQMLKIRLGKVEEKVNPDTKKEKEKYSGTISKGVWKRKQFTKLYSVMNLDFQQKQQRITEEIINADKHLYDIQFQMILTFSHTPNSASILIKLSLGDPEGFKEFGKFFISTMQNWFMMLLKSKTSITCPSTAAKIEATMKKLEKLGSQDKELDSDDDDIEDENIGNGPDSDSDQNATPPETNTKISSDTPTSDTQ